MESTVPQQLDALTKLQEIDSKSDDIRKIKGALPEEVRDLEDEIIGYETRVQKFQTEVKDLEQGIADRKNGMKESEGLIKKYQDQQMNVRNNREYDAISKETELQELEIQINEKRIKESYEQIEVVKVSIEETSTLLSDRKKDLDVKKDDLSNIDKESEADEAKLTKERTKANKAIELRLLNSYNKIRNNAVNGLGVVQVKRGACGGCFNTVPPQRQADIKERKKIIVCEHCGRILADVDISSIVEVKKPKRTVRKKKA